MTDIHEKTPQMPPVNMEPLRKLVALVHDLEHEVSVAPGITVASIRLVNLHLAVKAIANYPLDAWDADPLVTRRWSELHGVDGR